MSDIFDPDNIEIDYDTLLHYGTPRHSGRYPWGSGDNPYQHEQDWLSRVKAMERDGKTEKEIAEFYQLGTVELRSYRHIAVHDRQLHTALAIKKLIEEDGLSPTEAGRKLGLNESSVRSKLAWLEKEQKPDTASARTTADFLKQAVEELGGGVDVGEGVERKLGNISRSKLEAALSILENEGYSVVVGNMDRVTNPTSNNKFTLRVLVKGEAPKYYIRDHLDDVHSINELNKQLTDNGNKIRPSFVYPESLDISRLKIVHADEDGLDKGIKGKDRDGLVEIRRGVKDLDMGDAHYAQVRILVDGDRYIKGMAVYRDPEDMPKGVDVVWNTNKPSSKADRDILKECKTDSDGNIDRDNPFGSLIKEKGGQTYYDDPNGKYVDPETGRKQSLSLINKRAEEGDWGDWTDAIPAQFLSKQPKKLVQSQLKISIDDRKAEYEEIMACTNPTVKKQLLLKYADSCEKGAETLKAAAFPNQKYQVILPLPTLKDTEVYAPNYEDGTQVALVRYPHGGTFEIPIVTVNNKSPEGRRVLGATPSDAIGINPTVAARLSGADFDGDTVQVIPMTDKVHIKATPQLQLLKDFDPHVQFGTDDGKKEGVTYMKYKVKDPVTGREKTIDHTQQEMGKITNLITDMTLQNAGWDEIARATAHSMVIIDAAKHKLDYKRSEKEFDIPALKRKYQGKINPETGRMNTPAATIVSRAGAQTSAPRTKGQGHIDPNTGKMVYAIDTRPNKKGEQRMVQSKQMREVDDAFELVYNRDNPVEVAYAEYANALKSMGRKARLDTLKITEKHRDPSAAQTYAEEVASLTKKLESAQSNQDVERWANIIATQRLQSRKDEDPLLEDDKKLEKKLRQQFLTRAREETGAKREKITYTSREWEAIQAGAVGNTTLAALLKYTDPDEVRKWAMPKYEAGVTDVQVQRVKALADAGYTQAQIADRMGLSKSAINKLLLGKED